MRLYKFIGLIFIINILIGCQSQDNITGLDIREITKSPEQAYTTTSLNNKIILNTGKIPSAEDLEDIHNKNLILALGGDPKSFNYWASNDVTSHSVSGLMYKGLITHNPDTGSIEPDLAQNITIQDNGKIIIIELKKNIKWSDNAEITADDIIFTWNEIIKNGYEILGTRESLLINNKFPTITKIDKYTVKFQIDQVFAPLLGNLSYPIAPKHYFAKYLEPAQTVKEKRQIFTSLMGTASDISEFVVSGPYKLAQYIKNERLSYIKNNNYYVYDSANNQLPYFEKLTYVLISSNDLQLFKFANGDLPYVSLTGDKLSLIQNMNIKFKYNLYDLGVANTTMFLSFNMDKSGIIGKPQSDWFNNWNFREAINYLVDRQEIIDTVYLGIGKPLCLYMSENALFFNWDLHKTECNITADIPRAKKLLQQGGFSWNAQNQLIDKNNNPVIIKLYTNASSITDTLSPRELMATILKKQFAKLGIQLDLKIIEFNNLVGRISQTQDWETVILGLSSSNLLEPHGSANVLRSDGRLHFFNLRPANSNKSIPLQPWEYKLNQLLSKGSSIVKSEDRRPYYNQLQEVVWKEKPLIYLVSPSSFVATNSKLQNFRPTKLFGYSYNTDQWFYSSKKF